MTYIPINKEYISKDSVMKLLGDHFNIYENLFIKQIDALPTFSPEAIIEEMINRHYAPGGGGIKEWRSGYIYALEDALKRIRAENIS